MSDYVSLMAAEIWAMHPAHLRGLVGLASRPPVVTDSPAPEARMGSADGGKVAVIPIRGVITHRDDPMFKACGTSVTAVRGMLSQALASRDVSSIVLDMDSPGGTVSGVQELAAEVHAARASKRVVAVANTLMASAAYWIGSQADQLVASPSARVGSVGVYMVHYDASKKYEAQGVTPTIIKAGKYKAEGNDTAPLSEEAQAFWQEDVNAVYDQFIQDIARGRGVAASVVRDGYGEGRTLQSSAALANGMIDRVATLDDMLREMTQLRQHRDALAAFG